MKKILTIIPFSLRQVFLFFLFLFPFSYFCFSIHSLFLSYPNLIFQIIGYLVGALPLISLLLFSFKRTSFQKDDFTINLLGAIIFGFLSSLIIVFLFFLFTQEKLGIFKNKLLFGLLYWFFLSISQEIFFRGYFLKELLKNFSLSKSLILNSFIFSLWHITIPFSSFWLSFEGLIMVFLGSLFWGLIYIKTKNLLTPIISHFLVGVFLSQF